jgi:hypothetical protein
LSIPAVIRPFIIGKGGSKVQELQAKTLTNIKVPQSENVDTEAGEYEDDAVIDVIIEGDIEGCALAADLIGKIVKERVLPRQLPHISVVILTLCAGYYSH